MSYLLLERLPGHLEVLLDHQDGEYLQKILPILENNKN